MLWRSQLPGSYQPVNGLACVKESRAGVPEDVTLTLGAEKQTGKLAGARAE